MARIDLTRRVQDTALGEGASLVGFATMAGLAELPRAVAVAVRHSPEVFGDPDEMPTLDYYQEYLELNTRLDAIAGQVANLLCGAGYSVRVNCATLGQIDRETLAAPFSHKMAATRAGLGWIGKSALLVTPQFGPAVRLVSLLTDAPLAVGEAVTESKCGDCTACRAACPGGAVTGENWRAGRPRDEMYDAFACQKAALERAARLGVETTVCGVCMAVCPRRPRTGPVAAV
jgi:epoxyqueuosine reductase